MPPNAIQLSPIYLQQTTLLRFTRHMSIVINTIASSVSKRASSPLSKPLPSASHGELEIFTTLSQASSHLKRKRKAYSWVWQHQPNPDPAIEYFNEKTGDKV